MEYWRDLLLFVPATKMTTAANAVFLQYVALLYVAILGWWILKEQVKIFDWLILAATIGGLVIFFFDKPTVGQYYGNLLAVLSGVSFAFYVCPHT